MRRFGSPALMEKRSMQVLDSLSIVKGALPSLSIALSLSSKHPIATMTTPLAQTVSNCTIVPSRRPAASSIPTRMQSSSTSRMRRRTAASKILLNVRYYNEYSHEGYMVLCIQYDYKYSTVLYRDVHFCNRDARSLDSQLRELSLVPSARE